MPAMDEQWIALVTRVGWAVTALAVLAWAAVAGLRAWRQPSEWDGIEERRRVADALTPDGGNE